MKSEHANPNGDTGNTNIMSERIPTTSAPLWVKVVGIITIVLVLLVIILHLAGGGLGHHMPSSGATEHMQ